MHHVYRIQRIAEQVSLVSSVVAISHIDVVEVTAAMHDGVTCIRIILVTLLVHVLDF